MANRPKYHQFFAAFVASMAGITAGAYISWINYEEYHRKHARVYGIGNLNLEFMIFFLIAGLASIFSYFLIRWGGPLMALKIGAILTCIGWTIALYLVAFDTPFHTTKYLFAIMCGLSVAPAPLYIGEVAQEELRGAFASMISLHWKVGTLIADLTFELHSPRILCLACVVIAMLHLLLLFQLHETPFYHMFDDKEEKAKESLIWLRGADFDIGSKLEELERNVSKIREETWSDMFSDCFQYRRAWLIIFGIIFFHQFSGATFAILVSCYIFERTIIYSGTYVCWLIMGVLQILMITLSMCLVDRIGRRPLLMASAIGVSIAATALSRFLSTNNFGWIAFATLLFYMGMYTLGFGPILWVLISELFPADCKILACPFAVAIFWFFKILIDFVIQGCRYMKVVETDLEFGMVFLICGVITIFGLAFIIFCVPETKRKTFSEISEILK